VSTTVHKKVPRPLSYWLRHQKQKCTCGNYWFPHRKGSGACEHSSRRDYHLAIRHGVDKLEAMQLLSANDLEWMFPLDATALTSPAESVGESF